MGDPTRRRRIPWVTGWLCASLAAVHAVSVALQASAPQPTGPDTVLREQVHLLSLGAKSAALVLDAGEIWRLWTFHFVHTSWLHLAFNVAFLVAAGGALEHVVRRFDYLLFLGVAATVAGGASLLWTPEVSAGASGLVFAALGACVAVGLRHPARFGPNVRPYFGLFVLPFLLIILFSGLKNPFADHFSHLGGLVAGTAMGPFLRLGEPFSGAAVRPSEASGRTELRRDLLLGTALVLGVPLALLCGTWGVARALEPQRHVVDTDVELEVPAWWTPAFGRLGERTFESAGGLVVVSVDHVPDREAERWLDWYVDHRLRPLQRAGLIDAVEPMGGGEAVERGGLVARFRYVSAAGEMARELHLRRIAGASREDSPELPAHGSGVAYVVVGLETPQAWQMRYGEVFRAALASVRPRLASTPGNRLTRTAGAWNQADAHAPASWNRR